MDAPTRTLRIEATDATLDGDLTLPVGAVGIVAFAHGSGSSRRSARNRTVALGLQRDGLATLLFDLLTPAEGRLDERTRSYRFDVALLARRLSDVAAWLAAQPDTRPLPLGLFGASTGAAAALVTAARRPDLVRAVVSRGGRPDLAGDALHAVRSPTLLVVGERDTVVLELNREALRALPASSRLELVPRAGHLFEEPGALETVTRLASDWFVTQMRTT